MKLIELLAIQQSVPLNTLNPGQLKELQRALNLLAYPAGTIDGLIGPRTRSAWAEFANDVTQSHPQRIDPRAVELLQKELDEISIQHVYDFSTKEGTKTAIINQCRMQGISLKTQIAYVLASVEWETDHTFQPVKEAYWKSEDWRRENLRYYPYFGRGYIQLTWENNYEKYSNILGIDLINNPDLAMENETCCSSWFMV